MGGFSVTMMKGSVTAYAHNRQVATPSQSLANGSVPGIAELKQ